MPEKSTYSELCERIDKSLTESDLPTPDEIKVQNQYDTSGPLQVMTNSTICLIWDIIDKKSYDKIKQVCMSLTPRGYKSSMEEDNKLTVMLDNNPK